MLEKARVSVDYSPHSVRAASVSAAASKGLSLSTILKAAGWSNSRTFHKFYERNIHVHASEEAANFGQTLLTGFVCKK